MQTRPVQPRPHADPRAACQNSRVVPPTLYRPFLNGTYSVSAGLYRLDA